MTAARAITCPGLGRVACRLAGCEIEVEVAGRGVRVSRVAVIQLTDSAAAARLFAVLGPIELWALARVALDGEAGA